MPDNSRPKNLSDIFINLKAGLLGTKSDKVDKQIDSALARIKTYSATRNRNAYIDTLKTLVSSIGGDPANDFLEELNRIGGIDAFQQGDRLTRYKEYEEIIRNIAYCQRALRVLTDNILSPDDISKKTLRIITEESNSAAKTSNENDMSITRVKEINRRLQIEKKLDQLVMTTLKKGDVFIEVIYSPKGQQALTIVNDSVQPSEEDGSVLQENNETDNNVQISESDENVNEETINDSIEVSISGQLVEVAEGKLLKPVESIKNCKFVIEYNPAFGGTLAQQGPIRTGSSFSSTYKPFNLPFHSKAPQQQDFVDIEDTYGKRRKDDTKETADEEREKLKDKFGIDDLDKKNKPSEATTINLSDVFITLHDPQYVVRLETERFRTCLGFLVFPKVDAGMAYTSLWSSTASAVDAICLKILEKLQQKISTGQDKLSTVGDANLREVVYKYLKGIKDQDDLKIRYVPPEMMSHWRIGVGGKYDPYGEAILDYVKFDCKLYMALKTAMTIKRLTSATDKRVIKVETGLPRNAKNLVEMMKEGLRKRKYSIDQFGSVDTIPSHITTFEDIYIPMRDGKQFVEIDKMEFGPDPQQDTEPLKFIRDNIVANLNVPPAFIGLEENCLPSYAKIQLLQGFDIEIIKLVEEYEKNPGKFNQWTYSIDENNNIVPGRIIKAVRTRKNADLVRVHLDNEKYEDCTPDHLWMMRDGTYKEAKDLKPQDSLMPIYIKNSTGKTKNNIHYSLVYHPGKREWQLIYRMVAESLKMLISGDRKSVHHINKNPKDNHPDNLEALTIKEHFERHSDCWYNVNIPSTYSIIEKRNCIICDKEFNCNIRSSQVTCLSDACILERKTREGNKSWQMRKQEAGTDYELVKTKCASCGKEIEVYNKDYNSAKDHMLSCGNYECGRKVTALKVTLKIPKTNCVVCGQPIEKSSRILCDNLSQTCSIKCTNTVLANRRHHGVLTKTKCIICNKEIEIKLGKYDRPRSHWCSKECEKQYKKIKSYSKKNQISIEEAYNLWLNNSLPYQIRKEQRKEWSTFTSGLIKIEDNQVYFSCSFCGLPGECYIGEWEKQKKYMPFKCCSKEQCIKQCFTKNMLYTRHMNSGIIIHEDLQMPEEDKKVVLNHKVVRIEYLTEKQDCYDLEIENYHNFALSCGVFVHNSSNRALLTVESIQFARTIIAFQSEFSILLKDLFEKIYNFVYPRSESDIDHVCITFPPPKASTFEHMMEYLEQLSRILTTLEEMGVPKDYAKRKFLPDFDWDEIDKQAAESELKKELGEEPRSPNDQGGLGGGFGGLGGGMPPPM